VVASVFPQQAAIAFGEGEIDDQVLGRDLGGEPSEPFPLGLGEEVAGHPSLARRQALPGETNPSPTRPILLPEPGRKL
jgi:hypothetical protein